jgi:hypothetical protein
MDYNRHYNSLVSKAKNRLLAEGEYVEVHHIIPRSEGGTDEEDNLVSLTAREHFLAHWLLHRADPSIPSRAFSFWRMCNGRGKVTPENWYVPSSRVYEEGKRSWRVAISQANKGVKTSEETKAKISAANTGKRRTAEEKQKMSIAAKKRGTGLGWMRMRESRKIQDKRQEKPILQLDSKTEEVLKEFGSLKEAAASVNRDPSNLCVAVKYKKNSAGYKWRYKTN